VLMWHFASELWCGTRQRIEMSVHGGFAAQHADLVSAVMRSANLNGERSG
jgi:hypothetical protein